MKRTILEVEDVKKRTLSNFHKALFASLKDAKVLVLLWTTDDKSKKAHYEKIIKNYFKDLGASKVMFLEEGDSYLEEKFKRANVIYLPGGDPKNLVGKIKPKR